MHRCPMSRPKLLGAARLQALVAHSLLATTEPPAPAPVPPRPLPSFLSDAPPRSEGEALLQRIFSRTLVA